MFSRKSMKHIRSILSLATIATSLAIAPCWAGEAVQQEAAAVTLRTVAPPPEERITADPLALYGNEAIYDIYRRGEKIGQHTVAFSRDAGGDLIVQAKMNLRVNLLILTYTFDYSSMEIWRGKQVVSMAAITNDNGKITKTMARLEDGVFKIEGRANVEASTWVFPTNHWNRGQVENEVLLNPLNSRVVDVNITNRGFGPVQVGDATIEAEHFAYTGELRDIDSWYDRAGRWVKMRFKAKDGSHIEYICRTCQIDAQG